MEGLISPPPAPPQLQEEEKQSQPGHRGEAGWQQPLGTFPVLPGERAPSLQSPIPTELHSHRSPSPQSPIPTQLLPGVATARPHKPLTPKETWTAMGGWVWAVPMPQPATLPVGVWARFPQQHLHSTLRCPGFPGSLGEHRPTGKGHSRTSVPTWPDSSKLKCRGIREKTPEMKAAMGQVLSVRGGRSLPGLAPRSHQSCPSSSTAGKAAQCSPSGCFPVTPSSPRAFQCVFVVTRGKIK